MSDQNKTINKIFFCISPMLMFFCAFQLVGLFLLMLEDYFLTGGSASFTAFYLANQGNVNAILTAVSMVIAYLITGRFMQREISLVLHFRHFIADRRKQVLVIAAVIIGGISASIGMNMLLSLTDIVQSSADAITAANQSAKVSLGIGILIYGLLAPGIEEIIFRSLVYERFCRSFPKQVRILPMIYTSLTFAVYHLNLPQGIYAFTVSLFLCCAYQYCGGYYAGFILHASVNIITLFLAHGTLYGDLNGVVWCAALLAVAGLCGMMVWMTVRKSSH